MDRPTPSFASADLTSNSTHGPADRDERHVSLYRVGALSVDGQRELCVVRNVSPGGLMLTSYSQVARGSRIAVEFKHGEPVFGEVVWTSGNSVGMQFDEPIDVDAILAKPTHGLRPRLPRIDIECHIMISDGDQVHEVRAIDISQGGVCVESERGLPVGADVLVKIEGLAPEPAVVRWRNADCYGIAFNRPLSMISLASWLKNRL